MIIINNQEEMNPYYNEETNTYKFNSNVKFNCDIDVKANIFAQNIKALDINANNINACDITAWDINALDIKARDINADNIKACDISFNAVCFAYKTFVCNAIIGRRENSKYFCLDSDVVIKSSQ